MNAKLLLHCWVLLLSHSLVIDKKHIHQNASKPNTETKTKTEK